MISKIGLRGVIKFYDIKRGYGFISHESQDFFVHFSDIKSKKITNFIKNNEVSFDAVKNEKGWLATNVFLVNNIGCNR